MTDGPYELVIAPTARRQLSEDLPESVAFAAYEFIPDPCWPPSDRHPTDDESETGGAESAAAPGPNVPSDTLRG